MSLLSPSLPTPREGETACEMLERLPGEEKMRLTFRLVFRQLGAVLESELRAGHPLRLAAEFWESIEGTFAAAVMQYCRTAEYFGAQSERRHWEAEVDELRDANQRLSETLASERRMVAELQRRLSVLSC